ncbi:MAG TPA: tetratricopeptide repeat protein [Gemmatimonadaceae bacterium]
MADDVRRLSDELARDPSSLVFLQLGEALRRQGQVEIALKIALRGLERHPHHAEAHDLVARIAVDRRDFARAHEEWETVLRLAPDHVGAMKGLGYICFQQGRFDDAEQYLGRAVAGGAAGDVSNALEMVRRSSGSNSAAWSAQAATASDPQRIFADLLVDDGQTALLLDGNGYVLGGLYLDSMGSDVSQDIGAQLSGISDEVERSMRHLEIGSWRSIVFETQAAVVAMAPTADDGLVVVAASRSTPLGLLRRLLDRCGERAAGWLGTGRRS